jgi:hypothetical protein
VDRKNEFRAGVIRHHDRLFRIAVNANPGVIGADGHDGQIDCLRGAQALEGIGIGGIAAENDAALTDLDD